MSTSFTVKPLNPLPWLVSHWRRGRKREVHVGKCLVKVQIDSLKLPAVETLASKWCTYNMSLEVMRFSSQEIITIRSRPA